jgi:hypothetical protein
MAAPHRYPRLVDTVRQHPSSSNERLFQAAGVVKSSYSTDLVLVFRIASVRVFSYSTIKHSLLPNSRSNAQSFSQLGEPAECSPFPFSFRRGICTMPTMIAISIPRTLVTRTFAYLFAEICLALNRLGCIVVTG